MFKKLIFFLGLSIFLSACASVSTPTAVPATDLPTSVPTSSGQGQRLAAGAIPTPTLQPTLTSDNWMEMPTVPLEISERMREVYEYGQAQGNHSDVFIKIGDSNSTTTWFLGPLGRGEYSLGTEYAYLQPAIDTFQESFLRNSVSVKRGFNASSTLSTLWRDKEQCEKGETPLTCEIRIMHPAYALVMLGTNDVTRLDQFEPNMRKIIETLLDAGVIPILSTKVDNLEGDNSVNATIARLAYEYEVPLWNLWKALRPLENHGALPDDEAHLTWAGCRFDDPKAMESGLAWRNLTALQVINKVWQDVQP